MIVKLKDIGRIMLRSATSFKMLQKVRPINRCRKTDTR